MAGECGCSRTWRVSAAFNMALLALVLTALMQACAVGAAPAAKPPPPARSAKPPPSLTRRPPSHSPPPLPPPSHSPPPLPPPPVAVNISGKLIFKNTHTRAIWTLSTANASYVLPDQPLDPQHNNAAIPALTTISLVCSLVAGDASLECIEISDVRVIRVSAPVPTTGQTLRLLVVVVSLSTSSACAARGGAAVSSVQTAFTEPNGYIDFLGSCSYGKMVFDRPRLTVVPAAVPCSTAITRCNPDAIATAAKKAVTVALSSFSHFAYVLPEGLVDTCGWVGLAELPGTQTWYTPDNDGIFRKGTVLQELLHNFGLFHGWKDGVEYADSSTSMGDGLSCPSAPELWRLGWANPAAQLNSSSFPDRLFRTFALPATYVRSDGVLVKIQPDWLGAAYTKNVYLAVRMRGGGDRDLEQQFDQKLNIHELDKGIDNVFSASGDPRVSIIHTVAPLSGVDLTAYKLFVRTETLSGSTMTVKVCRYSSSFSECVDAARSAPPPSPRVSPAPRPLRLSPPLPPASRKSPPPLPPPPPSPSPPSWPSSPPSPRRAPSPPPRLSPLPPRPSPSPPPRPSPSPQPRPSLAPPPWPSPRTPRKDKSPPPSPTILDDNPPPYYEPPPYY